VNQDRTSSTESIETAPSEWVRFLSGCGRGISVIDVGTMVQNGAEMVQFFSRRRKTES